jgi:hypothetical protein
LYVLKSRCTCRDDMPAALSLSASDDVFAESCGPKQP